MVNNHQTIFYEKNGKIFQSEISFISETQLIGIIKKIVGSVGRRIDESHPHVDARLSDGSRIHAIIPPLSLTGPTLTIRKFPQEAMTLDRLVQLKSFPPDIKYTIEKLIKNHKNIIISGGTGTGKTSLLNACASCIEKNERIITIEDSAEIRLDHPHVISLESRNKNAEGKGEVSIRQLLKNALRMRPDRIIVGEIRSGEALDMLQAMNTGHDGSLTTIHANAPLETLLRLETMVLMSGLDLPIAAIRMQVIQAVDIIIQLVRQEDGSRKICQISKIQKNPQTISDHYQLETLYKL